MADVLEKKIYKYQMNTEKSRLNLNVNQLGKNNRNTLIKVFMLC